uniref:Uncharacterized protein n=1 Tax=Glossina austeni TaxID=7395 RepID=A0A1A9VGS8_GLOAU
MEHAEGRAGYKSSDYWCFRTLRYSTTIMICARVLDVVDFGIVLLKIIKFPKCVHNNNELLTLPSASLVILVCYLNRHLTKFSVWLCATTNRFYGGESRHMVVRAGVLNEAIACMAPAQSQLNLSRKH